MKMTTRCHQGGVGDFLLFILNVVQVKIGENQQLVKWLFGGGRLYSLLFFVRLV